MLVTKANFDYALGVLARNQVMGYDTEATALQWWKSPWTPQIDPRVFSMQFATGQEELYFDFLHSSDRLGDKHFQILNDEIFADPDRYWFIANAPFDLHFSKNHGIDILGKVHCTKAVARVMNSDEPSLSLDDLGLRYIGAPKLDVMSILKERGHFTTIHKMGRVDDPVDLMHFDRLTLEELIPYGCVDVKNCFDLGMFQLKRIKEIHEKIFSTAATGDKSLIKVLDNEMALTKIIYKMARIGVKIDRAYTEAAYENEVSEYKRVAIELDRIANGAIGKTLDWNSPKQLKPLFDAMGEPYAVTEKGNASFDKEALEDSDAELAKLILKYRGHYKKAHTYFGNYLWLADTNDVLHADPQQAGTKFGRMSYWTPNLQNVPKRKDKDEAKFKVRRCFIPHPGTVFVDLDYKGAEYYMSMDYAGETKIIEELKTGLDPHIRLATEMMLKDRDTAKTMQFRILYGGGGDAVGRALGHKGKEARAIGLAKKRDYFTRVPKLAALIKQVEQLAKHRGYIFNWLGRVLKYDWQTAYKSFNGLIQSGVGDMTKGAMIKADEEVFAGTGSYMLIQIHDSLLCGIRKDELHLVEKIKDAMRAVYPYKQLPMQVDCGYSDKNWSEMHDELPA